MATIYYDKDVDATALKGKTIAVVGFGSQGAAHAANLQDSGCRVRVGLRPGSGSWDKVKAAGLTAMEIAAAVAEADIIMILAPDEIHGELFRQDIAAHAKSGSMLMVAHGFSIWYQQIVPPPHMDVAMIAPKGPGRMVRREYTQGRGVPALLAVHQDVSGHAQQRALAYARGIGATRAGVIATTFKEETETDLFGEQAVLCGGLTALMKTGFDTLVQAGYQPEMAYFECIHEMKLIIDLVYEGGFSAMRKAVSNTAEYGDYITQPKLGTEQMRQAMQRILGDIQSGAFATQWVLENRAGQPSFQAMRRIEREHAVEKVGPVLRQMMPWLQKEG